MQRLKVALGTRSAKTVNNVLTVLSVMLKTAVEWGVIERVPCAIKLLATPKATASFYDFEEYERLVEAAETDPLAYLVALLGGEAGLRCGEIMALEWTDVDLQKRQLCVARSEWKGHVTVPKGGRLRYVPLTKRLTEALRDARHLRGPRVALRCEGQPLTQKVIQGLMRRVAAAGERQAGRAHPAAHVLFAPGDARRAGAGHPGTGGTSGPGDDAAVHAPESGGARRGDSVARNGHGDESSPWRNGGGGGKIDADFVDFLGKVVEAAGVEPASERPVAAGLYMRSRPCMFRARHQRTAKAPAASPIVSRPGAPDARQRPAC